MSLFKQSVLVSGSRLADKLLSLVTILVLSRHFGVEGLGEFNYFFSVANLFAPIMNLSVGMILLQRWHALDDHGRRRLVTQLLALKVMTGLLACFAGIAGDAFNHWNHPLNHPNPWAVSAAMGTLFLEQSASLMRRPMHARGEVWLEAALPVLCRVGQLALLWIYLNRMSSGFQVIYIYTAISAIELAVSTLGLRGCAPVSLAGTRWADWWDILKNGAPFAVSSAFIMASLHFDSVILGRYSYTDVGAYTAATRIIMAVNVLNGGVCHALFPKLMRAKADRDPGHAGWLLNGTLRAFLIVFGAITLGGVAVGQAMIPALYGDKFKDSGLIFCLLSPLILLSALYSLFGQTLEIMGQQSRVMRIYALGAFFNVAGNIALIPPYGMYGSAAATLVSTALTTAILFATLRKNEHVTLTLHGIGRALLFLLLLSALYAPLFWLNIWVAIPAGALIFALLLVPARAFWLKGMGKLSGKITPA